MDGKDQYTEEASVPAAASASASDDVTIAEAYQAIETLTVLYGFSLEAASAAVEHVTNTQTKGSDLVALCCDYILDQGLGIDAGGAIAPIANCPHVIADGKDSSGENDDKAWGCICVTAEKVPETIFDSPCQYFDEVSNQPKKKTTGGFKDDTEYSSEGDKPSCPKGENWWCLKCGGIYCSRYVNGHGVQHYKQHPEHCVMVGLADLSVWCHKCGSYLETHHNQRLSSMLQRLQDIKFRDE